MVKELFFAWLLTYMASLLSLYDQENPTMDAQERLLRGDMVGLSCVDLGWHWGVDRNVLEYKKGYLKVPW